VDQKHPLTAFARFLVARQFINYRREGEGLRTRKWRKYSR